MSEEERALLCAICAEPDSDLPRLVYADWLEEQGRGVRAEFIRLQCHLARALSDPEQTPLRARLIDNLQDLLNSHAPEEYHCEICEHPQVRWGDYLRGFPGTVAIVRIDAEGAMLQTIQEPGYPIDTLEYSWSTHRQLEQLLESGLLHQCAQLDLASLHFPFPELLPGRFSSLGIDEFELLSDYDWPRTLRRLVLPEHIIQPHETVQLILANWSKDRHFPVLDLRGSRGAFSHYAEALRERFGDRILL